MIKSTRLTCPLFQRQSLSSSWEHCHHQAERESRECAPDRQHLPHHDSGDALPDELQHGGMEEDQEVQEAGGRAAVNCDIFVQVPHLHHHPPQLSHHHSAIITLFLINSCHMSL